MVSTTSAASRNQIGYYIVFLIVFHFPVYSTASIVKISSLKLICLGLTLKVARFSPLLPEKIGQKMMTCRKHPV